MRNTILLLTFALISYVGYGQKEDPVLTFAQEMPTYVGGADAMMQKLFNSCMYPEYEKSMNNEGTVFIRFIVEKDGTPTSFEVERGVADGAGIDRAALNACRNLDKFNPGKQDGVPQRVYMTIPLKFSLQENDSAQAMPMWTYKERMETLKDAIKICKHTLKIYKARERGNDKRYARLCSDLELKLTRIRKKYIKGSYKEKLFEGTISSCLERLKKASEGK
jgi:TonB family protein